MKKLLIIFFAAIVLVSSCTKKPVREPAITTYKITATAGPHGTITPSGEFEVASTQQCTYTITPDSGYVIATLTVDGSIRVPAGTFTFYNVDADHTISATFSKSFAVTAVAGPNGTVSPVTQTVIFGASAVIALMPNAGFHADSLWIDGAFVKILAGATSCTLTNITATHTVRVTFSDALPQHSLDSLKNLLAGSWHYVQYDYRYVGTTNWIIAPYLTDCEKARHEIYTTDYKYTYFLGGSTCDPSYAPNNIYFDGTWKFDAAGKNILIAGNQYSNASDHEYVTGNFTLEKLTTDSLVISYPVSGKNFSYRYHYARTQ